MSAWDSVKNVIGTVAPTIAKALGGPLAGQAVTAITEALGLGPSEEDKAIAAIAANPDALLKLKQAEFDFKKTLVEAGIKIDELDVQDRGSARDLAQKKNMTPQVTLSLAYTVGYFSILWGLISGHYVPPEASAKLVDTLVAMLAAPQLQIFNFWFGSSHSSQQKDADIAAIARG